ncbi:uncharacterized protein LOC128556611 [Mercenaria mercenaria]|uniref:uncharacterized protein LOC128556611 n=1 Tax=Mercenaria mercenaria TaxID=6596 RepID=UPI00234F8A79|nr:uncharacterized protein LOC128556611 [Mercenaria mercenaria]
MDAMDQDKTALPRLATTPKTLGNLWRVKVGLMAALVHGVGIYGFFDAYQWGHGSSYTISALVHVLLMLDSLPDVLYLQLDNCPGQNKNRFVLGFLAYLIEAGVFKKVKLSFLMVGHTHEDIDQIFSRLSVWLSREDVFTISSLIKCFESCSRKSNITGISQTVLTKKKRVCITVDFCKISFYMLKELKKT